MISKVGTMLALASVAALGYVGAQRLGRWLDDPIGDAPNRPEVDLSAGTRNGWRRWTTQELSDP